MSNTWRFGITLSYFHFLIERENYPVCKTNPIILTYLKIKTTRIFPKFGWAFDRKIMVDYSVKFFILEFQMVKSSILITGENSYLYFS